MFPGCICRELRFRYQTLILLVEWRKLSPWVILLSESVITVISDRVYDTVAIYRHCGS